MPCTSDNPLPFRLRPSQAQDGTLALGGFPCRHERADLCITPDNTAEPGVGGMEKRNRERGRQLFPEVNRNGLSHSGHTELKSNAQKEQLNNLINTENHLQEVVLRRAERQLPRAALTVGGKTYLCVRVCTRVCMCVRECVHVWLHACIHVDTSVCARMRVYMSVCARM